MPIADTLENVFLDTMLSTSETRGNSVAIEPKKNWLRGWMLALLLILAGLLIGWHFPNHRLISMTADALMVAGILALSVDYFLKRDLLTEASRGIFVHLLGFEHHPEVKEKLKQIVFDTKILRAQCRLVVTVEPRQEDSFSVTVEYESDIVNSTATPVDFQPFAEWDAAHKPQYLRMQFTSSDGKVAWTETDLTLTESEPGVLLAKPHKVTLQPQSRGVIYHGSGAYKIISKHGYFMTHMGLPTLDFSIRVNIPDEYEVAASRSDVHTNNYWEYNSIRMVGEHLTVRWRKKGGEWL